MKSTLAEGTPWTLAHYTSELPSPTPALDLSVRHLPLRDSLSLAVSPGQSLSHRRPTAPYGLDSSCPTLL